MLMPTAHARPGPRPVLVLVALVAALVILLGPTVEAGSVVTRGSRERPWVALTFDDGWHAGRCEQIANTLRRKRATATFFINGSVMRQAPGRWRSILAGFPVANHTYSHANLALLSQAAIRAEVAGDESRIERILRRPMLRLLRPPYGAHDADVLAVARALGYRLVLWDVEGGDTYAGATTASVISRATAGGRGSIVLLHCGPAATPAAVGRIIDSYRSRGYQLVDLGQMLGITRPRPVRPPTACRVRNRRIGKVHHTLRLAVTAARPGDRLILSGRCPGATTIRKDLTVVGTRIPGSGRPMLDGQRKVRVLAVARGATVTLRALHIERGRHPQGGGIRNAGNLRLRDVVVRDNRAQHGAGIDNRPPGVLRLLGSSRIRKNRAGKDGGGLRNLGTVVGVRCGAGGNVRLNTPNDCIPAPTPDPDPDPSPSPDPSPDPELEPAAHT